ncbi:aspartic peptidase domain-containing protein [Suillus spraguei]|nr:aspartic peptidase domain-containing protein [Suillus spraguei]
MFSVVSLLALLASSVTGSPVEVRNSLITLPMRRTFSNVTDILRHDEARMTAFREYSTHDPRTSADVPLTNIAMAYTVAVNVGNPPVTYELVVDSSSSITWIGADTAYTSFSGFNTGEHVAVDHIYGHFQGTIFRDTLALTAELSIEEMPIAISSTRHGFDGVLGIGPEVSSLGALQNQNSREDTIRPVTDYLSVRGTTSQAAVGIFFQPAIQVTDNHGQLTFGGADHTMHTGRIKYTPVTTVYPSSRYWGINQKITYNNIEIIHLTAGVVDCGCTFLYIASDAYERYRIATGGIVNAANGLLQITKANYNRLYALKFYIGEEIYDFNRNAQIWPRSLNHVVNGNENDIFLVVKNLDRTSGAGYDFINGYVFLQRFYTVFDAVNDRVGFARTLFTSATTN